MPPRKSLLTPTSLLVTVFAGATILTLALGGVPFRRGWPRSSPEMEAALLGAIAILIGLAPCFVAGPRRWLYLALGLPIAAGLGFVAFAIRQDRDADPLRTLLYIVIWAAVFGAALLLERRMRRGTSAAPGVEARSLPSPRRPRRPRRARRPRK